MTEQVPKPIPNAVPKPIPGAGLDRKPICMPPAESPFDGEAFGKLIEDARNQFEQYLLEARVSVSQAPLHARFYWIVLECCREKLQKGQSPSVSSGELAERLGAEITSKLWQRYEHWITHQGFKGTWDGPKRIRVRIVRDSGAGGRGPAGQTRYRLIADIAPKLETMEAAGPEKPQPAKETATADNPTIEEGQHPESNIRCQPTLVTISLLATSLESRHKTSVLALALWIVLVALLVDVYSVTSDFADLAAAIRSVIDHVVSDKQGVVNFASVVTDAVWLDMRLAWLPCDQNCSNWML